MTISSRPYLSNSIFFIYVCLKIGLRERPDIALAAKFAALMIVELWKWKDNFTKQFQQLIGSSFFWFFLGSYISRLSKIAL
jgi:hypothetical protein